MRGGTSKGVFLRPEHLPPDAAARDRILLRIIGSPDRYGKQIDGMGAATSSTSKVVLVSKSSRPDCDVDYLFGQVRIDAPVVDWSGNCGNLTTAVGSFAISEGLVDAPRDGVALVRIWQVNIGKRILAHVPVRGGQVVEEGDFELDGVTFPAAGSWKAGSACRRCELEKPDAATSAAKPRSGRRSSSRPGSSS